MDPKVAFSSVDAVGTRRGKKFASTVPSLNLSTIHVILLSVIFTLLQNISLSRLPGASSAVFVVAMCLVSVLGYYVIHHLPLTTSMCRMKVRLALTTLQVLTKDLKFDLWVTVIAVLLVAWVLSIWKTGVSFLIWCFVIWAYNLDETKVNSMSNNSAGAGGGNGSNFISAFASFSNLSTGISNASGRFSSFEDFGPASGLGTTANSDLNSSHKGTPDYDKCYSASIGYINSLEKKVIFLEKKISFLENDKLEQNIIIYTFNHNLNEKLNNLEKKVQERDQTSQQDLNQIYSMLLALKKRKRIRLNILKLYIKQILLWLLPHPVVVVLRRTRRIVNMIFQRLRGFFAN